MKSILALLMFSNGAMAATLSDQDISNAVAESVNHSMQSYNYWNKQGLAVGTVTPASAEARARFVLGKVNLILSHKGLTPVSGTLKYGSQGLNPAEFSFATTNGFQCWVDDSSSSFGRCLNHHQILESLQIGINCDADNGGSIQSYLTYKTQPYEVDSGC